MKRLSFLSILIFALATLFLAIPKANAAFVPVVSDTTIFGPYLVKYGTYTSNGGSTGGDIVTNLNIVKHCQLTAQGAAVDANAPAVNETFPLVNTGGAVTIVTTANATGIWMCFGF